MMKMTFNKIDLGKSFDEEYFELNKLLNNSNTDNKNNNENTTNNSNTTDNNITSNNDNTTDSRENTSSTETNSNKTNNTNTNENKTNTKQTATIEDIIYPMYLPENTYLTNQEKIDTSDGQRLILTFEGDNPFVLVEETITPSDTNLVIPTSGDLEFLTDVIGVVNDNSVSWCSNGIEYYIISNTLETSELVEIAKSISVLPVSK